MEKLLADIALKGQVNAPSSKSDAQRAILIAALTNGTSIILNSGNSDDVKAMIGNVQMLRTNVTGGPDKLVIKGTYPIVEADELNFRANESGLTFRMLAALSTAIEGTQYINASGSLLRRSQKFMLDDIKAMGCKVESNDDFPPITVNGSSDQNKIHINARESSQFLSGILITLPLRNQTTDINVAELKSIPYVHMTLSTMKSFGVEIENHNDQLFKASGNASYVPCTYLVEGDWSGASYWFVVAALGAPIQIGGLNSTSFQADRAILKALEEANCTVSLHQDIYTVDGSHLKSFEFDATNCPDLFPALVVLAAGCTGQSVITGVSRLRNKESDRADVLQREFAKLGLSIELDADRMVINGTKELTGGRVDSHNDHRIAMCLAVSSILCDQALTILNAECVDKSYPDFWKDFDALG